MNRGTGLPSWCLQLHPDDAAALVETFACETPDLMRWRNYSSPRTPTEPRSIACEGCAKSCGLSHFKPTPHGQTELALLF